jgi:uncharacterized paraquat-inducible protein A
MYYAKGYFTAGVSVLALAIIVLLTMIAARSFASPVTDELDVSFELRKSLPR